MPTSSPRRFPTPRSAAALALAGALALAPPRPADAFCGFFVSGSNANLVARATRVALMRHGVRTVLTMSNDYEGPPEDFAMVVPVPVVLQRDNVRTLPHDVFDHLETLTAPRLVEYWEQDPCYVPPAYPSRRMRAGGAQGMRERVPAAAAPDLGVRIEARFVVGEYQVLILSATQSSGLETWLRTNRYNVPQGAAAALAPYVRDQWKFFVARVDIERAQRRPNGGARLSPLRFHYDDPQFRLPVRLGLLNAPDAQDLIVYVLHPTSRFQLANYANAFVPTNLDVTDGVRAQFPEFYARLFDATMAAAGGRAVVTEYAWATSSCDPCPTPPLGQAELEVLGADVVAQAANAQQQPFNASSMVVTRLHTRYNRATLTDDLVFQEAGAVAGGREHIVDANGGIEQGPQLNAGVNSFQARYAIRHPWTGPIACANPRRGRWGGPPDGQAPRPVAARDLATVPRGRVELASVVRTAVPSLGLAGAANAGGSAGGNAGGNAGGVRRPVRVQVPQSAPKHGARGGALAVGALAALGALGAAFRRKK